MKSKIFYLIILGGLISLYLWFRPQKATLPSEFPSFPDVTIMSTEWYDQDLQRSMLRFESTRRLDTVEMYRLAAYAREKKDNPQLTILFEQEGIKADYGRIDYPGANLSEPNSFERPKP